MDEYEASVQPQGATRNWDEDPDPRDDGFVPPAPLPAPRVLWEGGGRPAALGGRGARVVVGLPGAGELFVRHCLCGPSGAKRVGALVLGEGGEGRGAASVEEAAEEARTALVFEAGSSLLVAVQYDVPAEVANSCAPLIPPCPLPDPLRRLSPRQALSRRAAAGASGSAALLAALGPSEGSTLLVLDAQPAHTFYTDAPSPPTPPLLLKLESAAHQAAGLGARVQRSPAPNHVSGAAAALLTRAEYGGVAAAAYLTLQDTQDVSGASLAAFAPIVQARPRPPPSSRALPCMGMC